MKNIIYYLIFALFLLQCKPSNEKQSKNLSKLNAVLWQNSAEASAVYYQTYQFAKIKLIENIKQYNGKKKLAIISDVDETILNNSVFEAKNILLNRNYPKGWVQWIKSEKAKPFLGSLKFFKFVHSKKIEIFYITNRKEKTNPATYNNLKKFHFPVKEKNILARTNTSSKKERRNIIQKNYHILLYLGDNLNDFNTFFEKKSLSQRATTIRQEKIKFAQQFILFPNPIYGSWEGATFQYNYRLNENEKINQKLKLLQQLIKLISN